MLSTIDTLFKDLLHFMTTDLYQAKGENTWTQLSFFKEYQVKKMSRKLYDYQVTLRGKEV